MRTFLHNFPIFFFVKKVGFSSGCIKFSIYVFLVFSLGYTFVFPIKKTIQSLILIFLFFIFSLVFDFSSCLRVFSFFSVNNIFSRCLSLLRSLCSDYDNCQSLSLTEKCYNLWFYIFLTKNVNIFGFFSIFLVGRLHL